MEFTGLGLGATPAAQQNQRGTTAMQKWEHSSVLLKLQQKMVALSRKDILEGLDEESAQLLQEMGNGGWELVSALALSYGGATGMFAAPTARTDGVLCFFRRPLG